MVWEMRHAGASGCLIYLLITPKLSRGKLQHNLSLASLDLKDPRGYAGQSECLTFTTYPLTPPLHRIISDQANMS